MEVSRLILDVGRGGRKAMPEQVRLDTSLSLFFSSQRTTSGAAGAAHDGTARCEFQLLFFCLLLGGLFEYFRVHSRVDFEFLVFNHVSQPGGAHRVLGRTRVHKGEK